MGCVYSEVATYVDQGWNKVIEYRRRRSEEMKAKKGMKEDCFHDGFAILDSVRQIHHDIVQNRRMNDFVTPQVVNRLVGEMMLVRASRPDARYLYDKSKRIIDEAQAQLDQMPALPPIQKDVRRLPIESISSIPPIGSSSYPPTTSGGRSRDHEVYQYDHGLEQAAEAGFEGSTSRYLPSSGHHEQPHHHKFADPAVDVAAGNIPGSQQGIHQQPLRTASFPYRPQYPSQDHSFDTPDPGEAQGQPMRHKPSAGTKEEGKANILNGVANWTPVQRQSPHASSFSTSSAGENTSYQRQHGRAESGSKQPQQMVETSTDTYLRDRGSPTRRTPRRRRRSTWMPHPEMTVDQGLEVKKEREHGKKVPFPPENQQEDLFENLLLRDHVSHMLIWSAPDRLINMCRLFLLTIQYR